jgi:hypothetical protein
MADTYKITGYDAKAQAIILDAVVNGVTYTGKKKMFVVTSTTTAEDVKAFVQAWYEEFKKVQTVAITNPVNFPADVKALVNQTIAFDEVITFDEVIVK